MNVAHRMLPPSLADSQHFYALAIGLDGYYLEANPAYLRRFGLEPIDLRSTHSLTRIVPEDRDRCIAAVQACMEQPDRVHPVVLRKPHPSGEVLQTQWEFQLRLDAQGEAHYLLAIGCEWTEQASPTRSQRFQADLLAAVGQAMIATDAQGTIQYWNRAAERLYGWNAQAVLGRLVSEVIPSDPSQAQAIAIMQQLRAGHPWSGQCTVADKQGRAFMAEGTISPVLDEQGRLTAIIGVSSDISARLKTQQELAESEEKYRFLFDHNNDLICLHHPDGTYLEVSAASQKLLGYAPEELVGRDPYLFFHPEDCDRIRQDNHEQGSAGRAITRAQYRMRRKDGQYLWFDTLTEPIYAPDGEVEKLMTTSRDITEMKQLSQQMEQLSNLFEAMLHNTDDFIFFKDREKRFLAASKSLSTFIPFQRTEELHGKRDEDLIPAERVPPFRQMEDEVLATGRMVQRMEVLEQPEGRTMYVDNRKYPILNPQGEIVGVYAVARDVTALREAEEARHEAQRLAAKNQEMEEFAYVASHDLQEPLRTISNYAKLMIKNYADQLDPDGQYFLQAISQATLRMKDLILGLLTYSQLGLDQPFVPVDLNVLVEEVRADLHARLTQTQARLEVGALPTLPGYAAELRSLFQNLISNAVKFRHPDRSPVIKISAQLEGGHWALVVEDNGIGIAPQHQERIFKLFQRLHVRSAYEGTGIGLAHCKKIVELHHGRIGVTSTLGQGSRFAFTLRVAYPEGQTPATPS
jgi:PAS domain S-box-containing protein